MKQYRSITIEEQSGCGSVYITFCLDGDVVKRIFVTGGKWGTCLRVSTSSNESLINEMLSAGKSLDQIRAVINNVHCFRHRKYDERWTWSCVDSIAHAIDDFNEYNKSILTNTVA
jgi:hypothetical protein